MQNRGLTQRELEQVKSNSDHASKFGILIVVVVRKRIESFNHIKARTYW